MASNYITIPTPATSGKPSPVLYALVGSAFAVAAVVGYSATASLYAPARTAPVLAAHSLQAATTLMAQRPAGVPLEAAAPLPVQSRGIPTLGSPMGAAFGGIVFAAIAGVAAFALNVFHRRSLTQQLENAELNWSMSAATAFIGTRAPDFKATAVADQEFVELALSQFRGKKYVVLFFYPLDFTFVCPTEITAFSDRVAEFNKLNTQVLGVSVDSQFSHLAWVQTPRKEGGLGDINYPLIADLKKEIAESYGVLTEDGIALRGLFIIDKEGIIQHATINNLAFGRNVDETLRVLEAVQYVQAHPDEVCPAGWKKGDKTMKPDPKGSKEYFQAI
eukprot:TRINITY_DN4041_c0_g1_i1.p1 TRINITY_DN4041_c0_g1~~TRINITY_DN4041_c0_g1_i1.p1  ORF type:complete len:340 (-),score=106.77 TRINITY_DN4041_c0_g1_i1:135-1133(-)